MSTNPTSPTRRPGPGRAAAGALAASLRWPAEWEPHEACWLAWPSHADEWGGDLDAPRREVASLAAAIADVDPATGQARGERVDMLVLDEDGEASARAALGNTPVRFHQVPFGDIWLRDTGPIFVHAAGGLAAARFAWNGWGGKYLFDDDIEVGDHIAARAAVPVNRHPWILEGGAIDGDGHGTVLTTRQCLLSSSRNPGMAPAAIEDHLAAALGVRRLLWLDRGLINDHTDGHVDTLARFVAPGRVVCMRAADRDDPNREALDQIARDLRGARDARGRPLEVVEIPAPGRVVDARGALMPASYVNFYLGNRVVAVPVYGSAHDHAAVDGLAALFPERRVIGLEARGVLGGGGAFHCISREQPAPAAGHGAHPHEAQP